MNMMDMDAIQALYRHTPEARELVRDTISETYLHNDAAYLDLTEIQWMSGEGWTIDGMDPYEWADDMFGEESAE